MQEFTYLGEMHISIVNLLEILNKEISDRGEDDKISYEICFESSCHQRLRHQSELFSMKTEVFRTRRYLYLYALVAVAQIKRLKK